MVASSGIGSRGGADSGKIRGGGGGGGEGSGQVLKKGPWTAAEDAILTECVRKHGEGNWNAVRRNSGLLRCGKSCRLRWANHLRPNLKKGSFSPQEERLIIELHAKLGNKWARMALQLPGRTDNEIKNFWNTRVKRLQRANLPIYPDDIHRQHGHPPPLPPPLPTSEYSNSKFDPFLSLSLFDSINFPTITNPLQPNSTSSLLSHPKIPNHQFEHFHDNESIANFPFQSPSSILEFSSETSSFFFQREILSSASPFQSNSGEFDMIRSPTMEGSFNSFGLVPSTELTELPSIQSPVFPLNTPTSSGTTGGDYMMGITGGDADADACCVSSEAGSGGLLEDLLEESKALVNAENSAREISVVAGCGPGSGTGLTEDAGDGVHDSISANSSVGELGVKEKDSLEEMNMNPIDDDLFNLLNNFPLPILLLDANRNTSKHQPLNTEDVDFLGLENRSECTSDSLIMTASATTNPKWSLGSSCCSRNNMPGIC